MIATLDAYNFGPADLLMVCPLSSKVAKSKNITYHVLVHPPIGGLKAPSVVLCDQLRVVSKSRLFPTPWGSIDVQTQTEVDKALRFLLGL